MSSSFETCALALGHPSERSFGGAAENSMVWRSVCVMCVWIADDTREMRFAIVIAARSDRTRLCAHSRRCWSESITIKHRIFYAIQFSLFVMKKTRNSWMIGTRTIGSSIDTSICVAVYFPFCQSMRYANSENKQLKFNVNDLHCDLHCEPEVLQQKCAR